MRANRAIQDAARGKADVSCMQALPKDLGEWRPAVEFFLGPFGCGKNLDEISAVDFARSVERDVDAYCRQGFGALVAKLGSELTVQLKAPVTRMHSTRNFVEMDTGRGFINGARRDRHGVERRARGRQDQVHARAAASASSMRSRS